MAIDADAARSAVYAATIFTVTPFIFAATTMLLLMPIADTPPRRAKARAIALRPAAEPLLYD